MENWIVPLNTVTVLLLLVSVLIFVFKLNKRKVFIRKNFVAKDIFLMFGLGIAVGIAVLYFITTYGS